MFSQYRGIRTIISSASVTLPSDQHGVALGGGVQHSRTGAQEVRAARVVPGDGLQRRTGCQVDVFEVVRPVDVEVEGERREGGQFGAGAEQAENAVGHAEQA